MRTVAVNDSAISDEQGIIDVIVLAFGADPGARRMFPEPTQYLRNCPKFVRAFGGQAFHHGTACHLAGFLGAALWLPPDVHPDEEALAALIEETVTDPVRKEVFAVSRADGDSPSTRAALVFTADWRGSDPTG